MAVYSDGRVMVPFSSYAGQNSGIPIAPLTIDEFRAEANTLFGLNGPERQARTAPGWLTTERADPMLAFCSTVAEAYAAALQGESEAGDDRRSALDRMVDIAEEAGMYEATAEPKPTR